MSATAPPGRAGGRAPGGREDGGRADGQDAAPAGAWSPRAVRAVLVALGLVLALAVVTAAALAVVSVLVRQEASGTQRVEGVRAVRVENRCGGDVEVTGLGSAGTGRVDVVWDDAWSFGRPRHERSLQGGRLVLSATCPVAAVGAGPSSDLRVEVPGGVPVEVGAGAGDVTATGLVDLGSVVTGAGDVEVTAAVGGAAARGVTAVRTGSGDVVLAGVGGDLDVRTGSGAVRATGLTSASVVARTGSGDVDLRAAGPPRDVVVTTGSGDVALTLPATPLGYAVSTTTGSGQALVGVAREASSPLRVAVRTGSGDVEVLPGPSRTG